MVYSFFHASRSHLLFSRSIYLCLRHHRLCVALSSFRFSSCLDLTSCHHRALGKFNLKIAVLQEQKSALQHTLNEVREESARKQTMYTSVSASFEKALA